MMTKLKTEQQKDNEFTNKIIDSAFRNGYAIGIQAEQTRILQILDELPKKRARYCGADVKLVCDWIKNKINDE